MIDKEVAMAAGLIVYYVGMYIGYKIGYNKKLEEDEEDE